LSLADKAIIFGTFISPVAKLIFGHGHQVAVRPAAFDEMNVIKRGA
jgi:hypothetical protein